MEVSHQPGIQPQIHESWKSRLINEFQAPYFRNLKEFLVNEKKSGKIVFPPGPEIFNAFNHTPFDKVKVVIIGQDPYHGPGQANGLCFSVTKGIALPPSLKNILTELQSDLKIPLSRNGDLTKWADQGVLLLNATLTVRMSEAGAHQNKGWEQFTDAVIRLLSEQHQGLIFLLWGRFAQAKESLIDKNRHHHILTAAHPSPFSAYNGFFGCRHFSKVNEILNNQGLLPVDWSLNP